VCVSLSSRVCILQLEGGNVDQVIDGFLEPVGGHGGHGCRCSRSSGDLDWDRKFWFKWWILAVVPFNHSSEGFPVLLDGVWMVDRFWLLVQLEFCANGAKRDLNCLAPTRAPQPAFLSLTHAVTHSSALPVRLLSLWRNMGSSGRLECWQK
jgi:hypothetical protein